MIRIIDNKKIDLTDDEFRLYEEICRAYDRPHFKGKDLFKGLFETDKDGIIIFVRPPTGFTSMEVFLFIESIFCHQHVRQMYKVADSIHSQLKEKVLHLDQKITQVEELISKLTSKEEPIKE
jgi:hypothetical protein